MLGNMYHKQSWSNGENRRPAAKLNLLFWIYLKGTAAETESKMWSLIVVITQACILHAQTEDFLNKVNIYSIVVMHK